MISDATINPGTHASFRASVGGNAVHGEGQGNQRAAHIHIVEHGHDGQVSVYAYGAQQTAELCDALASLVGQLLATVNRDDVDPALATNIGRNLGAAASRWAGSGRAPIAPSSVADAVAEDAQ